jgi:hypothetical protein
MSTRCDVWFTATVQIPFIYWLKTIITYLTGLVYSSFFFFFCIPTWENWKLLKSRIWQTFIGKQQWQLNYLVQLFWGNSWGSCWMQWWTWKTKSSCLSATWSEWNQSFQFSKTLKNWTKHWMVERKRHVDGIVQARWRSICRCQNPGTL